MFKKKGTSIDIDTHEADKTMAPRFKSDHYPKKSVGEAAGSEMKPTKQSAKFGKKKGRKQAVALMMSKARKGA